MDTRFQLAMALLSSGKCSSGEGSSPPSLRGVGTTGGSGGGGGGGGNAGTRNTLIPPGLYCPMLPPWHLALLTHHALHAKGELRSPGLAVGWQDRFVFCSLEPFLLCVSLSRCSFSFPLCHNALSTFSCLSVSVCLSILYTVALFQSFVIP